MRKHLFLYACLLITSIASANTIIVNNIQELNQANTQAKPGDIIILKNGNWKDVTISLNCLGTKEQPITFKAETPGSVAIIGKSCLKIGGTYIIVQGLTFKNGYAGKNAVIDFRIAKNQLANNCRVTECTVNDFNNKRMEENYWVSFSGKKNEVDHCSFAGKKNMGVLMAIILDDDRSRENFHSIDHNYFGTRLPLASNSGEIIRIGVSEHSQFNSNTQVTDNYFYHCDGETEIISVKSSNNVVRNNLFEECQGGVVLRHGNYNTVEGNVFLGNGKEGTGGVRIINKGQWIVNNLFYKCRGVSFRSPLSIMNGIPNSPAYRYVQVSDAVIANNTWYNCAPASFCEGSDTERTLPPVNVHLVNNSFYNNKDGIVYKTYDNINGFTFTGNNINKDLQQKVMTGFERTVFLNPPAVAPAIVMPVNNKNSTISDSLQEIAKQKLGHSLSLKTGFEDLSLYKKILENAHNNCGAPHFSENKFPLPTIKKSCTDANALEKALAIPGVNLVIDLTGKSYVFTKSLVITTNTEIRSAGKTPISFTMPGNSSPAYLLMIQAGQSLKLTNLSLDLSGLHVSNVISTDTSGAANHSTFFLSNSFVKNVSVDGAFFSASKSSVCDSINITGNSFEKNNCELFSFENEKDKKGYYNVEKMTISNNKITNHTGTILNMLRGGNDESSMGPDLLFTKNTLTNCKPSGANATAAIWLWGIQRTVIGNNSFTNCYSNCELIKYEDAVRADHTLINNSVKASGVIIKDKYVH
ncbi:MAG: polysaccharide lyase 6 family protein [Chitinophagaceae bacterium]